MTKIIKEILAILFLLLITSCSKNHKVETLKILGNKAGMNNRINLCLEKEIGYSSYLLKFKNKLNDGTEFETETVIYGHTDNTKKCFELYTGSSFTRKGMPEKESKLISNIFEGNVNEMIIELYESGELVSTSTFKNL
ncbi:hypothetical protein [Tenacibaculum ovolyticum]|uniref:hypothetical protein n=1 Tax=Tenacibaculum ovolyticum TaxID=104270 RepID=UPI0012DE996E|nr:hypothetical protein [Tenacibaculum ovolyticum]